MSNMGNPIQNGEPHWRQGIRRLHPGYLAMVMATGIISTATQMFGHLVLSNLLLAVGLIAYLILVPLYLIRLIWFPQDFVADLHNPWRAFGFFTFVAGSDVLAIRLAGSNVWRASEGLLILAVIVWLILTYLIPASFYLREEKPPFQSINGVWLVWVVGTQSIAAASATVALHEPHLADGLAAVAVSFWALGVILYLILVGMIMVRMMFFKAAPEDLSPPYWIIMGACAISVVAGGRVLALPVTLPMMQATRPVVEGITFMLWAWGTWWIPMLVIWGVWRHFVKKVPLKYDPTWWSMVFPLGMYSASSAVLGTYAGFPFLVKVARQEIWVAVVAWALVLYAMLKSWVRRPA